MTNSPILRYAYSVLLSSTIVLISAGNAAGGQNPNIFRTSLIGVATLAGPMQDPPPAEFQLDKLDLEGLQKVDREK
ncbi:MAG: hypothetical protein IPL01_19860 [Acidobacteria bacterium]|nr:hypothetical protein [Acidobacteriota bacterium]